MPRGWPFFNWHIDCLSSNTDRAPSIPDQSPLNRALYPHSTSRSHFHRPDARRRSVRPRTDRLMMLRASAPVEMLASAPVLPMSGTVVDPDIDWASWLRRTDRKRRLAIRPHVPAIPADYFLSATYSSFAL